MGKRMSGRHALKATSGLLIFKEKGDTETQNWTEIDPEFCDRVEKGGGRKEPPNKVENIDTLSGGLGIEHAIDELLEPGKPKVAQC